MTHQFDRQHVLAGTQILHHPQLLTHSPPICTQSPTESPNLTHLFLSPTHSLPTHLSSNHSHPSHSPPTYTSHSLTLIITHSHPSSTQTQLQPTTVKTTTCKRRPTTCRLAFTIKKVTACVHVFSDSYTLTNICT